MGQLRLGSKAVHVFDEFGHQEFHSGVVNLVKSLDDFEKNYGPKTIQKYVGIIDGRVSDIEKRLSGAKTDEERDAYALLQRFQQQFNKTAFETSGKAVTQPEMQRLVAALGNVKSNNFANDVRNFAKMSAEDLHRTIKSFKDQYRIRPEQVRLANDLIKQFNLSLTPFGQQRQSTPAGSTGTAPSSGGIKIESVEVIP